MIVPHISRQDSGIYQRKVAPNFKGCRRLQDIVQQWVLIYDIVESWSLTLTLYLASYVERKYLPSIRPSHDSCSFLAAITGFCSHQWDYLYVVLDTNPVMPNVSHPVGRATTHKHVLKFIRNIFARVLRSWEQAAWDTIRMAGKKWMMQCKGLIPGYAQLGPNASDWKKVDDPMRAGWHPVHTRYVVLQRGSLGRVWRPLLWFGQGETQRWMHWGNGEGIPGGLVTYRHR